jgi:hypothetical protein
MNHRPGSPSRSLRVVAPVAALLLVALVSVAGCSSGGNDDMASRSSLSNADAGGAVRAPAGDKAALSSESATDALAARDTGGADVQQRAVIAKGALELRTKTVDDVRRRAVDVASTANGVVADEQTDSDDRGRAESVRLVLRVPVDRFDSVLDALARLGRLEHRSQSAQDVTTQAIDVAARVRAQRASVESIERLYARARTIGEVMAIETQLAKRQAALDSLERQQKYLADQTALATISVTISRTHPTAAHAAAGPGGFLGGLADGGQALATAAPGLAGPPGAARPCAVLAALVGVAPWLMVRRRRQRPAPAEPANG